MRLEVIREFLTLSEDLNYTKAAKKLHMTQSTLSKHMSDLERELGLSLFNHSVANPALTDVGGLLLQRFSLIDAEICNALDACKELQSRSSRSLRIQLSELSLVQKIIKQYLIDVSRGKDISPSVKFVEVNSYAKIYDSFLDRIVDVAVDATPGFVDTTEHAESMREQGFLVVPLVSEPFAIWCKKDHPIASLDTVSLNDVRKYPIITSAGLYDTVQKTLMQIFAFNDDMPKFRRFYFEDRSFDFTYFALLDFRDGLMFTTSEARNGEKLGSRTDLISRDMDDEDFFVTYRLVAELENESACDFIKNIACYYNQTLETGEGS